MRSVRASNQSRESALLPTLVGRKIKEREGRAKLSTANLPISERQQVEKTQMSISVLVKTDTFGTGTLEKLPNQSNRMIH